MAFMTSIMCKVSMLERVTFGFGYQVFAGVGPPTQQRPEWWVHSAPHDTSRAAIFAGWDPWKAGDFLQGPRYPFCLRDLQLSVRMDECVIIRPTPEMVLF